VCGDELWAKIEEAKIKPELLSSYVKASLTETLAEYPACTSQPFGCETYLPSYLWSSEQYQKHIEAFSLMMTK
jgi:hypothetical protein